MFSIRDDETPRTLEHPLNTTPDSPVLTALQSRRSVPRVRQERPPRYLIERVIAAAAWAPNHYKTEPWRFAVVSGDARRRLGDIMEQSLRRRLEAGGPSTGTPEEMAALLSKERNKPLRAPVIIAVAALPSDLAKAEQIEEIAAVAAAIQNMLLAADALGLGAMWRTGRPVFDPAVKQFLGFPDSSYLLALLYLGFPLEAQEQPVRVRDALQYARWMGWDDDPETVS